MKSLTPIEKLIKGILEKKGISIRAFCLDAQVTRTTIYRIFRADGRYSIQTMQRVADALDCKLAVLLDAEIEGRNG